MSTSPYIIHFRAGSWYKGAVEKHNYKQISPEKWLEKNKRYWWTEPKKEELKTEPPKSAPEPEKPKPSPEEKVMPVEKKKEAEVKYLKMAKTSDRKIGVLSR